MKHALSQLRPVFDRVTRHDRCSAALTVVVLMMTVAPVPVVATAAETQAPAGNGLALSLPEHGFAESLLQDSPFGINTAFSPDTPDLEARLTAMQRAGIKWGRQDFHWRHIEKSPGKYDWAPYDRLVEQCRQRGLLLFGDLAYAPRFHDPRTPDGVAAYCALARAAAKRYAGRVDHWQIWNEPNGGFWKGTADEYARLLAAAGRTIHEANRRAKVLGLKREEPLYILPVGKK